MELKTYEGPYDVDVLNVLSDDYEVDSIKMLTTGITLPSTPPAPTEIQKADDEDAAE